MKKKVLQFTAILFLLALYSSRDLLSQYSNTMYFMRGVPQANMLNPAFQPACNFYLGMPGLSPLQLYVGNSSLSVHDVVFYNSSIDSSISFLHPLANKDLFLENLDPVNSISTDISTSILSFGFRSREGYFSFQLSQKAFFRVSYPRDLFHIPIYLTLDGQGNPFDFDLSGFGLNASAYTELAFGYSYKLSDQLSLGGRWKLLMGEANLSTSRSDISVNTEFDKPWRVNSKVRIDASLPFVDIPLNDTTGKFDFDNIGTASPGVGDILDAFLFHPNTGMALDLGVSYQPIEALRLSASVLDLGFIRWRNSTYNLDQNVSFTFRGIDMSNYINGSDTSGFGNALVDSLKNSFEFSHLKEKYTTGLPTQIFLGGNFSVTKGISFGALGHFEVFNRRIYNQLTLSTNLSAGKFLALSLSYPVLHNPSNEIGLGFAFKPGPFNMYMIFDNIPTTFDTEKSKGIPIPVYMKGFSFRIGMNLIFGCNKEKKINKDIPLVD